MAKQIAIIGGAEQNRTYEPPVMNHIGAIDTARVIGEALARAGYHIVVYHPGSIETAAVSGFLNARPSALRSIIVVFAKNTKGPKAFGEFGTNQAAFESQPHSGGPWGIDFFRSISAADGVVLIGGGRFTFTMGMLALINRIPLVACAAYGGTTGEVWDALKAGNGLSGSKEIDEMAQEGSQTMADVCVTSLKAQLKRKRDAMRPAQRMAAFLALALLIVFAVMVALGYLFLNKSPLAGPTVWLLFLGPLVAAAAGAAIGSLFRRENFTLTTTVLGAGAGLMCGYFYLIAHLVNDGPITFITYIFDFAFSFIGGFTADRVLKQLQTIQALNTKRLSDNGSDETAVGSSP